MRALLLVLALVPSAARAAKPTGLAWPLDCVPGGNCDVTNFPDPAGTGQTALCRPNSVPRHEGTDIRAAIGTAVFAAADGVVLWTFDGKYDACPDASEPDCQETPGQPQPGNRDGAIVCTPLGPFCRAGPEAGLCYWCFAGGNVIVLRHELPGAFATRYDHLRKGSVLVAPAERVKRGQKIAEVASAGRSTDPHLHIEVWGRTFYDPVDPWKGPCSPTGHRGLWSAQPKLP
jgi:murein DD-endopeptidase MepM/ murein hydrolase activator NlpD